MRKSKIKFWCVFLLLNSLWVGCLDTIDLELNSGGERTLIIEGFAKEAGEKYIFSCSVRNNSTLVGDVLEEYVPAAKIDLVYNDEAIMVLQNGVEQNVIISEFHDAFGGTPDNAFFNVVVSIGEGVSFSSDKVEIHQNPSGSKLSVGYEVRTILNEIDLAEETGFVKLFISSSLLNDFGSRISFRWDISGVYRYPEVVWTEDPFFRPKTCYVSDPTKINDINVLNSHEIHGDQVLDLEIDERLADDKFSSGYYYTVLQHSLSADAANYWQEVKHSVVRQGTLFDVPAGTIRTNIKQMEGDEMKVMGYFYGTDVDTLRYFVHREEVGEPGHQCALQLVSEACCDCIKISNSSYVKPPYWNE